MPVIDFRDGRFCTQYSRTFVEEAQRSEGVPKMTAAMDEALDMLAAVAEQTCHVFRLSPGDMVFYNNLVVYHGRTPFTDDPAARADRLLSRPRFSHANTRPLPETPREPWGSTNPSAPRRDRMTRRTS